MSENKTKVTDVSVLEFINSKTDGQKKEDALTLLNLYLEVTKKEAVMWGPSIIGFGSYHYTYASGREGDAPLAGFSPRKDAHTIYISTEFPEREALLEKLGKHKVSKACVYIKKLDDIDLEVLKELIRTCMKHTASLYPTT